MSNPLSIRIEVPQLPPVECSPNYRGHWSKRYQASRVYHNAVFYSAVDARNRVLGADLGEVKVDPKVRFPLAKARLDLTFVFPEDRIRDVDNHLARWKPGQDALVDAGIILGDDLGHLTIGKVRFEVDAKRAPLTIIELEKEGDKK